MTRAANKTSQATPLFVILFVVSKVLGAAEFLRYALTPATLILANPEGCIAAERAKMCAEKQNW